MSTKFFLLTISLASLVISLIYITSWVPFFSDQVWFYNAAHNSLARGGFPLVFGMKSSITWLHHGAFWLYILLPALKLTGFHPLTAHLLTVFLNILNIPLVYYLSGWYFGKKTGLLSAFIFAFYYNFILQARLGYHISLIPLLFLISALCLVRRKYFLSGLFLAFLYQVHLLAVIYWPLVFLYLIIKKEPFLSFILGSLLGLVPFLLAGPIQAFGVVAWLLKNITRLSGSGGVSNSQSLVFSVPLVIIASAALSRLNTKLIYISALVYIVLNLNFLLSNHFYPPDILYGPDYSQKLIISRQILQNSRSNVPVIQVLGGLPGDTGYPDSYKYLVWWLQKQGIKPVGNFTKFVINETTVKVEMLK